MVAVAALDAVVTLSPKDLRDRARMDAVIRELRASNTAVHQQVLRELAPLVERWVRGWMGPRVEASDVTQEALCEIAAALYRFEGRASLSTFAHRVALRVAQRAWRRRRHHEALDEEQVHDRGDDPAHVLERREISRRLYSHLDRMNERRRTALVLCEIDGLSPTEAAEVLGISAVSMRNRLFESRRELKRRVSRDPVLGRMFGDGDDHGA